MSVIGESANRDLLALAAVMLAYPDDALCSSRGDVVTALAGLPASKPAKLLAGFADWWAGADPAALRLEYVDTFDNRRRTALYVTYAVHGDERTRGQALYDLKQLYAEAGFETDTDELPDYLPMVCQFAALAPAEAGLAALGMARDGVQSVRQALEARGSKYGDVLAAIAWIIQKGALQ